MIGFDPAAYNVGEDGSFEFVIVKQGRNERPVTMVLNTVDGSAVGKL